MKNQLRTKSHEAKQEENQQSREESTQDVGGRELGQVIEPMQSQMASGNEGLTDKTANEETKPARKDKPAA